MDKEKLGTTEHLPQQPSKKRRPWRASVRRKAKKARLEAERSAQEDEGEGKKKNSPEVTHEENGTTKANKKRRRRKKKASAREGSENNASYEEVGEGGNAEPGSHQPSAKEKAPSSGGADTSRLSTRLEASRFRFINEQLYTQNSKEAMQMFHDDPNAFAVYHRGFAQQVAKWPANPLDSIIAELKRLPASTTVADVGCGEARIVTELGSSLKAVHSFDLVAANERVSVADMAHLPLEKESVDVAVYCLSLMGTNTAKFLREANRILTKGGELKIAEVLSRFPNSTAFIKAVEAMGFRLKNKRTLQDYFLLANFVKTGDVELKRPLGLVLKPCLYKKR